MIPYSGPKLSDFYTLSHTKLLEIYTLYTPLSPPPPPGISPTISVLSKQKTRVRFLAGETYFNLVRYIVLLYVYLKERSLCGTVEIDTKSVSRPSPNKLSNWQLTNVNISSINIIYVSFHPALQFY